jgi:PAS domain-containing protein
MGRIPTCRVERKALAAAIGEFAGAVKNLFTMAAAVRGVMFLRARRVEPKNDERQSELEAVLNHLPQGICIFDSAARIVMWNERYKQMCGLPPGLEKHGLTLGDILAQRAAAGTFSGNVDRYVAETVREMAEGRPIEKIVERGGRTITTANRPLPGGGWTSSHEDITAQRLAERQIREAHSELEQREEDLRLQNMKLDAALRHMSQGLAMFDSDCKLVFCNEQYADLYGLPLDLIRPGMELQQILEHRIAHGIIPKLFAEEYVRDGTAKAAARTTVNTLLELSNGHVLSVIIRPTPDGGWVTTHEDVTERRRAEAKIAQMAHYDMLTGLPNRVLFGEELGRALARVHDGAAWRCCSSIWIILSA